MKKQKIKNYKREPLSPLDVIIEGGTWNSGQDIAQALRELNTKIELLYKILL